MHVLASRPLGLKSLPCMSLPTGSQKYATHYKIVHQFSIERSIKLNLYDKMEMKSNQIDCLLAVKVRQIK
jgi:hypothetical protein